MLAFSGSNVQPLGILYGLGRMSRHDGKDMGQPVPERPREVEFGKGGESLAG